VVHDAAFEHANQFRVGAFGAAHDIEADPVALVQAVVAGR